MSSTVCAMRFMFWWNLESVVFFDSFAEVSIVTLTILQTEHWWEHYLVLLLLLTVALRKKLWLSDVCSVQVPTKATCGITRFGVGVSLAICFAVLLVKLMVILTSRSSENSLLPGDVDSPNYLKGIYQFLMFVFAVGVQVSRGAVFCFVFIKVIQILR